MQTMAAKLVCSQWYLFGISILPWWLTLASVTIYYLWNYYQNRNNMNIKHRHHEIVLLIGIFCILFWTIEQPLEFI